MLTFICLVLVSLREIVLFVHVEDGSLVREIVLFVHVEDGSLLISIKDLP